MSEMPLFKRNLIVLWCGCFITGVGLSLVTPFIPLFIATLGDYTTSQLSFYSGIVIAAPFLMQVIVSPLWGKLADRSGRRPTLMRASLGMAVIMAATGFTVNIWMLLGLRALFGLFSGYIANAIALIAVQVPKEQSGRVLGTLNTANVGGVLVGPIFGGSVVTLIGYAHVFFITGGLIFAVFLLTVFLVKENFVPVVAKGQKESMQDVFRKVNNPQLIIGMFLTTLILTLTNSSINPILSLYVKEVGAPGGNVEFWSGLVAAAPGISTIIAAPRLGALGDRIGTHKVLMFGLVMQMVVFLPMAFVTQVWQIIALRMVLGVGDAALLPGVQAMLTRNTPKEATSRIFAYNQSAQASGMVAGPLVGAAIGGFLDLRYVFFATMFFAAANLTNMVRVSRLQTKKPQLELVDNATDVQTDELATDLQVTADELAETLETTANDLADAPLPPSEE